MKVKRIYSSIFLLLFLLGGIWEKDNVLRGSFYGVMWFTGLFVIPNIVTDLVSKRWKESHLLQMVVWYSTALLTSMLIINLTGGETKELRPVIWGILLSFIWMFIRGGYLSKIEEKIDSLLQPNIPTKESPKDYRK